MALARKFYPNSTNTSQHRSWYDTGGNICANCSVVNESTLMRLAASADRIVLREAPGKHADPRTVTQIIDKLHATRLLTSGVIQNGHVALKRLRITLGDRLARTRIVDGRHALASLIPVNGEAILLVVLASQQVSSCSWRLAI
jgi:hypothetical protein